MNWKPINTAPKDGTRIIVCHWKHYSPITASWRTYHPNAEGKAQWRDDSGIKTVPTHWDILPEEPMQDKCKKCKNILSFEEMKYSENNLIYCEECAELLAK
ncbi:hypothetical protein HHL23_09335 [Chryseobacterium sp. RP-3-3]|uniref:DUF551 domain-containing protein n=1 Tax=Chryseobacterium antibioticum TaxID=2728847 RepID=A0A7Y0FRA1_9FLAO|nr:hypothetical protein [Chryseobacterium antibioticum]NML70002.1 hypothetical protein [Chryseobacterium antibioticum]